MGNDGLPTSNAFKLKENEQHLSVNWLEYFGEIDDNSSERFAPAIQKVIAAFERKRYQLSKNGCFAVLTVGVACAAIEALQASSLKIEIRHQQTEDDPSHAGIFGYADDELLNLQVAVELRRLIKSEHVYST